MTAAARRIILLAAFGGLLFDGMELGLMPIAPLSVTKSLRGGRFTDALAGDLSFPKTHPALIGACFVRRLTVCSYGDARRKGCRWAVSNEARRST